MKIKTLILVVSTLLLPSGLFAQAGATGGSAIEVATPYGSEQRSTLQYAGERPTSNVFMLDSGYQVAYDDNVLDTSGTARQGDEVSDLSAHLSVLRESPRLNARIEYAPFYEFYRTLTDYNRLDQNFDADLALKLGSWWSLRVQELFVDQTSTYQNELNDASATGVGLASPTTLNSTIYVPMADEQSNSVRSDLLWQPNNKASLAFFGAYDFRNFSSPSVQNELLTNTREASAGTAYARRVSEHVTFGVLYLNQGLSLTGNVPSGYPSHLSNQSVLPSLGWHIRPTVRIAAFAGPSFVSQTFPAGSLGSACAFGGCQVVWTGGGTVARQMDRSSWLISAERVVSDGGGFLAFVVSSSINAGFRQQLPMPGRWDASWNIALVQNRALDTQNGLQQIASQSANFGLEHNIRENLTARLSYEFARQNGNDALPTGSDFHRNRITLGIHYRWGSIPLGH